VSPIAAPVDCGSIEKNNVVIAIIML